MPTLQIEVNDAGQVVGDLPKELSQLVADRASIEAKTRIEAALKDAKASGDPLDKERIRTLESDLSRLREDDAIRGKRWEEALAEREKRAKADIDARDKTILETKAEVDRRTTRLQKLGGAEIRAAAVKHGATEKALDQLDALLTPEVGLDGDLAFFVKDAKDPGKPRVGTDGKPVTVDALVSQYLTDNPHMKAAPSSRGGGAGGGRSLQQTRSTGGDAVAAAAADLEQHPTDRSAPGKLVGAILDRARSH